MIYFYHGKDVYSISNETKKIVSNFNSKSVDIERIEGEEIGSIDYFKNFLQSQGLFSSEKLIIIKNILLNNKSNNLKAEVAEVVKKLPSGVTIIFTEEGSPDKRGKLYKTLHQIAKVKEFPELNPAELEGWIRAEVENKKFKIKNIAVKDLAFSIGNDLYLLKGEIEKLILYAKSQKVDQIDESHVFEMVESIDDPQIFPFIEAVAKKDVGRSFKELKKFTNSKEGEHYLLSMIIYQFRTLLMVKDLQERGMRTNEIAKEARLHPFVVQKSIQVVNKYSKLDLIKKYFLLHQTDFKMKSGELDPKIAIDLLVAKIAS